MSTCQNRLTKPRLSGAQEQPRRPRVLAFETLKTQQAWQASSSGRTRNPPLPSSSLGLAAALVRLPPRRRNAADRQIYALTLVTNVAPGILEPAKRSEEHTSELQSLMRLSYA